MDTEYHSLKCTILNHWRRVFRRFADDLSFVTFIVVRLQVENVEHYYLRVPSLDSLGRPGRYADEPAL
jgi:hypothetical protein